MDWDSATDEQRDHYTQWYREEAETRFDKKGFLDTSHFDFNALHALSGPIALIEQLCTIAQGSVEDYAPAGQPIRKAAGAKGAQNAIRDRVQQGCVAFARNAEAVLTPGPSRSRSMMKAISASTRG